MKWTTSLLLRNLDPKQLSQPFIRKGLINKAALTFFVINDLTWDVWGKRAMASGKPKPKAATHTIAWTGRWSLGRDIINFVLWWKNTLRSIRFVKRWCTYNLKFQAAAYWPQIDRKFSGLVHFERKICKGLLVICLDAFITVLQQTE